MQTAEFLRRVLPLKGYYFLATKRKGQKGYTHIAFTDAEDMADTALRKSGEGLNVFFAVANYAKESYIGDDGDKHWRTQENAVGARALWMDVDVGEQYEWSQKLAILDMQRFCKEAGLPIPNVIVSSGNGVHIYWCLDEEVPKSQWLKAAALLKSVTKALNFATDDGTRTADIASVLRPVGTNNDKSDKGLGIKPVTLLRDDGRTSSFSGIVRALVDVHGALSLSLPADRSAPKDLNDDLIGEVQYPPSSAAQIAERCGQLRFFRDFKGAGQNEPTWRACLGVLKHTVDGVELAHEWSSGYERYDYSETQAKMDNWNAGPSTCATFQDCNPTACAGCLHKGKSPISLGYPDPEHVTELVHEPVGTHGTPGLTEDEDPPGPRVEHLPDLPAGMKKKFAFDPTRGLCAKETGEDGQTKWVTFCSTFILPDVSNGAKFRDDDTGEWKMLMAVRKREFTWESIVLDTKVIGSGGATLSATLASVAMIAVRSRKHMERYMATWMEEIQRGYSEVTVHAHLGWQSDESFVVGETKFLPDGNTAKVIMRDNVRGTITRLGFEPVGDFDRYRELLDYAYNRPGHQVYQFTYLAGYASALVSLMEPSKCGLVFAGWSRESGFGKSTATRLAAGVWHDPANCVDAKGTTEYALYEHAGLRCNLPLVLDEYTQWTPEQSGTFPYRYSSGAPREQGRAEGGLRDNMHKRWSNICLCSGNRSLHEDIRAFAPDSVASIMRVFEYKFDVDHKDTMGAAEGKRVMDELSRMRGMGGALFTKYLATNKAKLTNDLLLEYERIMSECKLDKSARFWVIGAACVMVAHKVTQLLGVHMFDESALREWVYSQLDTMSRSVLSDTVDYLAEFGNMMSDFTFSLLVTEHKGDSRTNRPAVLSPKWPAPRGHLVGRLILATGELYLSGAAITAWCADRRLSRNQMLDTLERMGWVLNRSTRVRFGTGTDMQGAPVLSVYLDWKKISASEHGCAMQVEAAASAALEEPVT